MLLSSSLGIHILNKNLLRRESAFLKFIYFLDNAGRVSLNSRISKKPLR
ncbi:hypothetical protein DB41_CO00200 [Neochlamydia sp. TUME1]|nr:hypothetical protein DB41_CO00200 [Neochlamydia sp. TUME1]